MNLTSDPTSLITGIFDAGPAAAAKRAPFELRAGPFVDYELQVVSFHGRERVNDVYEYDVTFATQVPPDLIHTTLLGGPACLTVKSPGQAPQVLQGIVASLEALGGNGGDKGSGYHRYRLTIVPRLWLLKRHRVNRIFQGKTVIQIVETLLRITGMSSSEIRWRVVDKEYPPLPFVYQRNESDYDFFRRVLASAGIFFYFEHANALPAAMAVGASVGVSLGGLSASASVGAGLSVATGSGTTVLNFARRASDTPALTSASVSASLPGGLSVTAGLPSVNASLGAGGLEVSTSGALLFDDALGSSSGSERVYAFGLKKRVRAQALQLLERDVAAATNWIGQAAPPSAALSASASLGAGGISASASMPTVSVSVGPGGVSVGAGAPFDGDTTQVSDAVLREERYQIDPTLAGPRPDPAPLHDPQMDLELARTRRRYVEARGKTDCRRVAAGYRFTLTGHTVPALNGEYTVTALDAEGHNPDFVEETSFVYRGTFRCIPSAYMPIPPRPRKRPKLGLEVAQVVAFEDILKVPWLESSPCGYVKIRFRWDILDAKGTPARELKSGTDDEAAIWVPVMQPWAGAGYGSQFIPREGMEVLVGFLEHQGERPVILGCLYSEANAPPWNDKAAQEKVGIRSQTRATNGGYSEISIHDTQGQEVLTVRAQKDLSENVLNDRTSTIGVDDSLTVGHDRTVDVGNDDTLTVKGDAVRTVTGTDTCSVTGDSTTTITGDVTVSVQGTTSESLVGDVTRTLAGDVTTKVAGVSDHSLADDYTERHLGHRSIIVGSGDAHRAAVLHVEGMGRAYASKCFEVEVLEGFTLVCGSSQIIVSPTGITICSPNTTITGKEVDIDVKTLAVSATDALTLAGKTVTMQTAGAKIALDASSANVTSTQISLGSGSGSLAPPSTQPVKITKVQMKDAQGKPRANVRVLLTTGGKTGEQRMTVLDADGELELIGDTQYAISFPDDPVAK